MGHVAWFAEHHVLGGASSPSRLRGRADGDALYDSAAVAHGTRWALPLPTLGETLDYLAAVERDAVVAIRDGRASSQQVRLAIDHEDMHGEAFAMRMQALGGAPPDPCHGLAAEGCPVERGGEGDLAGDARVPGGSFLLGASDDGHALDNERDGHLVELKPFAIARAPVTQAAFAAFAEDGGYRRPELWSAEGWQWRRLAGADGPLYWRRAGGRLERSEFGRWVPLEPHRPVVNVCWYESEAFCQWAGRRLPSEAEWEGAAVGVPGPDGRLSGKRRLPWGDESPGPERAHLDARSWRTFDVAALPAGDSAFGCRQMIGNVWEWTASPFLPYPGFRPGRYPEYSQPSFGTHKVLRGGCFVTRGRLLRSTWRNFYAPDRRDPWAGFRTCAP